MLRLRVRCLFHAGRVEQELDEELRYHIERLVEQNLAAGMSPEEARYAALREMGGLHQHKEECRDARGLSLLEDVHADLKFALRQLVKTPGFTTAAIATMALGIGANTAIFSIVNGVLLKPLPYDEPGQVVQLFEAPEPGKRNPVSPGVFGRLVRQLLAESLLLSILGGLAGVALALWSVHALTSVLAANVPRVHEIGVDAGVLAFALGLAVVTGVAFGLGPGLSASRANVNDALKEEGRGSAGGRARMRNALIVSEVALSVVLLVGAGLLLNSFLRLTSVAPGFEANNALTMQLTLPAKRYPSAARRAAFFARAVERIPLIKGRSFDERDSAQSRAVTIVNETLARAHFPNEDPLGRRIVVGDQSWEIVGVGGDVRLRTLAEGVRPLFYRPIAVGWWPSAQIVVRTTVAPLVVAEAVRKAIRDVDSDQPVTNVQTLEEVVAASVAQRRLVLALLGGFSGAALLLAAIGLYGVIAYAVGQRTRELAIRMALGAQRADVQALVLRGGLKLTGMGIILGVAGAVALTRLLGGLLYGVKPTDPATFAGVVVLILLVATVASWLPAHRASRLDATQALGRRPPLQRPLDAGDERVDASLRAAKAMNEVPADCARLTRKYGNMGA
jgi:hypothetical protein